MRKNLAILTIKKDQEQSKLRMGPNYELCQSGLSNLPKQPTFLLYLPGRQVMKTLPLFQGFDSPPQLPPRSNHPVSSLKWVELVKEDKGVQKQQLSLLELSRKHSEAFPLRVKVTKGFSTPQVEIPTGDTYNIHFQKKTNVVTIKDSRQNSYTIPFNSAAKFGVVYGQGDMENLQRFSTRQKILWQPSCYPG